MDSCAAGERAGRERTGECKDIGLRGEMRTHSIEIDERRKRRSKQPFREEGDTGTRNHDGPDAREVQTLLNSGQFFHQYSTRDTRCDSVNGVHRRR